MSMHGWREFLAAEGVDDWVVLHGGATAVFRVASLGDAARLATAFAHLPGIDGSRVLMTVADDRLSVRLSRDLWHLDEQHIELARASRRLLERRVSSPTARECRRSRCGRGEARRGRCRLLARRSRLRPASDDNAVDPLGHGSTVWMQELDPAKPLRHAMHVDVSVAREHVEARMAAALAAGGLVIDDAGAPASWILADRAGNRVCICAWPDGAAPSAPD